MKQVKRIDQIINQSLELGRRNEAVTLTAGANGLTVNKDLQMGNNKIIVANAPVEDTAVANKKYVDDTVGAIDPTIGLNDDGVLKGRVNEIDVVDNGANVKAVVAVTDKKATITMSHATPSGGTATGNTGANVIANVTKTADGHITAVNSIEVTPDLIGAQPAADALTSLAGAAAGVVVKTDANTVAAREITAGNGVTVTNGNGVDGNPTIAVADGTVDAKGIVQLENAASDSTTTAATPAAVKAVSDAAVQKAGDTMTGALTLSGDPTQANHAATKAYVDAIAQGLNIHKAVRVATTGAVTLSGLQTIDGVTLVDGDRVLVKDQANPADDGVYVAAAGAWNRAEDCNDAAELTSFYVFVLEGDTYGGFGYNQTTKIGTVGTTAQTWEIFNKPAEFTVAAGTGVEVGQDGRTYTIGAKAASTTQAGIVQLNNTVNSESTTEAATANAVKTVNDAVTALDEKTMDLVTGAVENNIATYGANGQVKDGGVGLLAGNIADSATSTALVNSKQVVDYIASKDQASHGVVAGYAQFEGTDADALNDGNGSVDLTSIGTLPAGAIVNRVLLEVVTPFNASDAGDALPEASLSIGGTEVMAADDSDLTQVGIYEVAANIAASGNAALALNVPANASGRTGSAKVTVFYHK